MDDVDATSRIASPRRVNDERRRREQPTPAPTHEGWVVLYDVKWRISATEEAAICLFQTLAPGAVVAPPTPAQ